MKVRSQPKNQPTELGDGRLLDVASQLRFH